MGGSNDLIATVLGSNVLAAIVAAFTAWKLRGRHPGRAMAEDGTIDSKAQDKPGPSRAELETELEAERNKVSALEKQLSTFAKCRLILSALQPVLLLGPRDVGKSSLVRLWHSPWEKGIVEWTLEHQQCVVPVIEWDEPVSVDTETIGETRPTRPSTRRSLKLKVHDFPGELNYQKAIVRTVREEIGKLREKRPDIPGVVIVCLFDAEEAHTGVSLATSRYYNGDLFRELKTLYASGSIEIERVVLVFNKTDRLREHYSHGTTNGEILDQCLSKFATVCAPIFGLVHPDRVCEVLTVLGSEDEHRKSEGAEVVKGEAARPLVELYLGAEAADRVTPERASRRSSAVMSS